MTSDNWIVVLSFFNFSLSLSFPLSVCFWLAAKEKNLEHLFETSVVTFENDILVPFYKMKKRKLNVLRRADSFSQRYVIDISFFLPFLSSSSFSCVTVPSQTYILNEMVTLNGPWTIMMKRMKGQYGQNNDRNPLNFKSKTEGSNLDKYRSLKNTHRLT